MPTEKRARQRALRDQKIAVVEKGRRRRRVLRRSLSGLVVVGLVILLVIVFSQHSPSKKASKTSGPSGSATTTTQAATTTTAAPTTTTKPPQAAVAPVCPPAAGATSRHTAFTKAPGICIARNGVYDATVRTDVGTFVFQMKAAQSLLAVNNFVFLARYHFYDGTVFHRVIPDFVVQGGDPTGTGGGGPGYSFTGDTPPAGCQPKCYALGAVAMANSGSPSSDGSQFFVVSGSSGEQLQPNYTDFGQVISGMSVVKTISNDGDASDNGMPPKKTHRIVSVTISQVSA